MFNVKADLELKKVHILRQCLEVYMIIFKVHY